MQATKPGLIGACQLRFTSTWSVWSVSLRSGLLSRGGIATAMADAGPGDEASAQDGTGRASVLRSSRAGRQRDPLPLRWHSAGALGSVSGGPPPAPRKHAPRDESAAVLVIQVSPKRSPAQRGRRLGKQPTGRGLRLRTRLIRHGTRDLFAENNDHDPAAVDGARIRADGKRQLRRRRIRARGRCLRRCAC